MSEDIKLSPWFDCGKDEYPIRSGVYQWELYIDYHAGGYSISTIIHCKAYYSRFARLIHLNGRFVSIQDSDQWRGIVPDVK